MIDRLQRIPAVAAVLLALVAGLATSGCGPDTGGRVPLTGGVTLAGAPLDEGTIEFHGSGGDSFAGAQIVNGRFEIPAERGVVPGSYEVRIYSADETAMVDPEVDPDEPPGPEAEQQVAEERIPARYNSETELQVQVGDEGSLDLQFDLEP